MILLNENVVYCLLEKLTTREEEKLSSYVNRRTPREPHGPGRVLALGLVQPACATQPHVNLVRLYARVARLSDSLWAVTERASASRLRHLQRRHLIRAQTCPPLADRVPPAWLVTSGCSSPSSPY